MHYYLTGKQARDIDRYTSETIGTPGIVLMERAALELANEVENELNHINGFNGTIYESEPYLKESRPVLWVQKGVTGRNPGRYKVLSIVGTGNNGGDAVAAARILKTRGFDAYVYEADPHGKKTESFLIQKRTAENFGVKFPETLSEGATTEDFVETFTGYDAIIDGLFGVGLSRDITGTYESIVNAINDVSERNDGGKRTLIAACDIPSGTDSDTGLVKGCAVRCDITVTFGFTKLGMLINEGRACSGRIICREIGLYSPKLLPDAKDFFDGPFAYEYDTSDLVLRLPTQRPDSNKGTNGKVLIVAGSKDIYGALYLCASSCYRAGAGLVKVVTHDVNRPLLMDKLPEAMMLTYGDETFGDAETAAERATDIAKLRDSVEWADVVLVGPGLGTGEQSRTILFTVLSLLKKGQRLVMDADALNIVSEPETESGTKPAEGGAKTESGSGLFTGEEARSTQKLFDGITQILGKGNTIVTPHVGETVRLMKGLGHVTNAAGIKKNPPEAARHISNRTNAVCVLKDARTFVADPSDERGIYINTTGNSGMSKGGSGDVLAGITAGLLARTKDGSQSAFETACCAVNIHGSAGDRARDDVGESCMLAGDMIDKLREL
ncbi:MAG: NAD(P)H-hydrate dehydratase [Lachnospiraceae bacterium]|nr:NAD(P)H-hydrate dehydratase [Lachnospiraceae bacterium]